MQRRQLGRNGLTVSALGLGCMGMSQGYGPGDDQESVKTIHRALELGITFFDTADAYGRGVNERLVGEALRPHRAQVEIATKFGIVSTADGMPGGVDGRPAHVAEACDASLARLGVDVIDLYYLHRVDQNTPIEDTVGAMARLVEQGKVRFLGLSEASPATIRRAHLVHPITALQSEYSLWNREPERTVLPVCRELGIGFVPFSPLGRGFLSATVTSLDALSEGDLRRRLPRFQGENFDRNLALAAALRARADARKCTAAQLALAWVLASGEDVVPIPGTKRRTYLEDNAAAASIVLTAVEKQELAALFPIGSAVGERYNSDMMRLIDTTQA